MVTIIALLGMLLLSSLGAALSLTTMTETMVAANFQRAQEGLYAADAAMARALDDLQGETDWDALPLRATLSTFVDGSPGGARPLGDGSALNLDHTINRANCGNLSPCSAADIEAVTLARPWGTNNPVWRLYAYGPLAALSASPSASPYYVLVMIADDPGRSSGTIWLRAMAFGPSGLQRTVDVAVAQALAGASVISWRDLR